MNLVHDILGRCINKVGKRVSRLVMASTLFALCSSVSLAASPSAGTALNVRAWAEYQMPDEIAPQRMYSNAVEATVAQVESLSLTGAATFSAQPGTNVVIPYLLSNKGNTTSKIALDSSNGGAGCTADTFDLSSLHLVLDTNNNGVADTNEPSATTTTLEAGQSVTVLLVGNAPQVASGTGCLSVSATTVLQSANASTNTTVTIDNGASLGVLNSVNYNGFVAPGKTLTYTVRAVNNGAKNAAGATTDAGSTPVTITVNGVAQKVLLLRNLIPAGTSYIGNSLRSGNPNVLKLFRLPGDAAYQYRTVDDASAIEVAVAELAPNVLVPGAAWDMSFSTRVLASATGSINSQGLSNYYNGSTDTTAASNVVTLPLAGQGIGVALGAGAPVPQSASVGKVHLAAVLKNYGDQNLFDAQIHHPLEAVGGLGSYVSGTPAAGQYSVVPGSMAITSVSNALSVAVPNPAFDGRPSGNDVLLRSPVTLRPGGSLTVEYDILVNFSGWTAVRTTQATAVAARLSGGTTDVTDLSQDGLDPDPNGAGALANNTPTPIQPMQMLDLQKTVESLKALGNGQYELTYLITLTNTGQLPATKVRVIDNLGCAMTSSGVTAWTLQAAPTALNGQLLVSSLYTGNAPCSTTVDPATGVPLATVLSLTDGTRDLAAGQTEKLRFTIHLSTSKAQTLVTNTAVAASFSSATGFVTGGTTTSALTLLADPQGVVYDSITRQPIAGAVVKLTRGACSIGSTSAITPSEVYNSSMPGYSFNADGSLSMTTDVTGAYQFYWQIHHRSILRTMYRAIRLTAPIRRAGAYCVPVYGSIGPTSITWKSTTTLSWVVPTTI